MPLLDPQVRKELNKIVEAIKAAPEAVREIPDVMDLTDTFSQIRMLKRSLRRELRDVVELIDSGEQPALGQVAGLRQALLDALQELRRPGGPPIITDDTDG